ncbi:MAG: PDZ domain-containing protein [Acidobacteriota bacterium]
MSTTSRRHILSLGAVGIGAAALGMVLAGGLGVTPEGTAREATPAPLSAATAPPAQVPAAQPVAMGYPDFAALADRVNPSVISVFVEDRVSPQEMRRFHRDMDPFEFFFGPNRPDGRTPRRQGAGSGFFIDSTGLAMTNNHVIEGADKVWVRLADDAVRLDAKVVGRDPATDLALIRVEGGGPFKPLSFGNSDTVRVGEWVMAAGNPLNMDHTITVGVVSAKGRFLGLSEEGRSFENFIQTDAAINLGNSGGPLVNLRGEVIGINTAINAAGQNLGFAVPVNTAKLVLPQLKEKGKVVRGYLGVNIRNIDDETRQAFELASRDGAFVDSVEKSGPAAQAGIEAGDVIVAVDGTPIKETRQLIDRVSAIAPGQKVSLEVMRDGKRKTLSAMLGERPGTEEVAEGGETQSESAQARLGVEVQDLNARLRRMYEVPAEVEGVVVTGVTESSPAEDSGLRRGDVITEVNGAEIGDADAFRAAIERVRSGSLARLYVFRPQVERSTFVIVRVP